MIDRQIAEFINNMNSDDRPGFIGVLPSFVRYDARLKPNSKLLYVEITVACDTGGICWHRNNYFANIFQVTTRVISDWIAQLVDYGHIYRRLLYKKNTKEIEHRLLSVYPQALNTPRINVHHPLNIYSAPSIVSNTNTITNTTIESSTVIAKQEKNSVLQDNTEEKGNFSEPLESKRRGRRISPDWVLSPKLIIWLNTKYPTYNQPKIASLVEDFINHWQSSARPNAAKYDWDAAFRTWVNKDVEWGPNQNPGPNNLASKALVAPACPYCKFNQDNPNETRPCPSHPLKPG